MISGASAAGTAEMNQAGRTFELDSRAMAVLDAVVRLHSETGKAVSSGLVVRYLADAPSSATIRAVMKSLEDVGLLEQPHTSAGRLPTDAGYRVFVDRLRRQWTFRRHEVPPGMIQLAERSRPGPGGADRIKHLARLLSLLTRNISIIVGPSLEAVTAVRLEFLPRTLNRVLMVLTLDDGQVLTRHLDLAQEYAPAVVEEASRLLNGRVAGRSIAAIRKGALGGVDLVQTPVTRCAAVLADQGRTLIDQIAGQDVELEGVSQVLEEPDFQDAEPLKALLRFIESPQAIRDTLSLLQGSSTGPFGVWIGAENPVGALRRFSVLTSEIELGGRPGLLAVLGPRRLPYQRAFHGMEILRRFSGGHPPVPTI
ncbi:MAG: hypothetical protein ABIK96_14825 [bacterium]